MTDEQRHDELERRIRNGIDPMLPRPGVEHRVLENVRDHLTDGGTERGPWWHKLRTTFGGTVVALAVVVVIGGALGITLSLHGHSQPVTLPAKTPTPYTPSPFPTSTPAPPTSAPTPVGTPGAIAYVQAASVSFPNASDGWAIGVGCDTANRCETSLARTTNGGAGWSPIPLPTTLAPSSYSVAVAAASSDDAWVWGINSEATPGVLAETHDGGQTWQQINLGDASVVDLVIADGTAWAETACIEPVAGCVGRLMSQSVHGGPWTGLGALPKAVQGPICLGCGPASGPPLLRSGTRAWVVNLNRETPALVSTSNGGRTWTSLPIPCVTGATMSLGASSPDHVMIACANIGGPPAAPQAVWTSIDGGAHWTLRSRHGYATLYDPPEPDVGRLDNAGAPIGLVVLSNTTAWMSNLRGDDLVTHDDGVTWTLAALPVNSFGDAGGDAGIVFSDALHGWTFLSYGMWATSDGGVHWGYQGIIGPIPGY